MDSMENMVVFDLIERMAALLRSEERRKCTELGLQPVHLQILDYLSRCNRYSDTPAALTNYLGMTRGTVSQTLLLLMNKGFISKTVDVMDRRVIHLSLLEDGKIVLQKARSSDLFNQAAILLKENNVDAYKDIFADALTSLQKANNSQSFGLCKTCRYFTKFSEGFICGLTQEPLSENDSERICQEHSVA